MSFILNDLFDCFYLQFLLLCNSSFPLSIILVKRLIINTKSYELFVQRNKAQTCCVNEYRYKYIFLDFHRNLFSIHSIMVFIYHAYIVWLIVNILHGIESVRLLIFLVISQNSKYCIVSLQYLEYFIFLHFKRCISQH